MWTKKGVTIFTCNSPPPLANLYIRSAIIYIMATTTDTLYLGIHESNQSSEIDRYSSGKIRNESLVLQI